MLSTLRFNGQLTARDYALKFSLGDLTDQLEGAGKNMLVGSDDWG